MYRYVPLFGDPSRMTCIGHHLVVLSSQGPESWAVDCRMAADCLRSLSTSRCISLNSTSPVAFAFALGRGRLCCSGCDEVDEDEGTPPSGGNRNEGPKDIDSVTPRLLFSPSNTFAPVGLLLDTASIKHVSKAKKRLAEMYLLCVVGIGGGPLLTLGEGEAGTDW